MDAPPSQRGRQKCLPQSLHLQSGHQSPEGNSPEIHDLAKLAYEGAIDFGAHPNLKGVAGHLSINENRPDGMTSVTLTSLYGSTHVETVRGLCACLDFGFAIIGMIALSTPDPGVDRVKRLIMELQVINDLKNDAVAPYQRPE
jgi:hypothetical protein